MIYLGRIKSIETARDAIGFVRFRFEDGGNVTTSTVETALKFKSGDDMSIDSHGKFWKKG